MRNCRQENDFYLNLDPRIKLIWFDKSRAWSVLCEHLWENWLRYNGTALYMIYLQHRGTRIHHHRFVIHKHLDLLRTRALPTRCKVKVISQISVQLTHWSLRDLDVILNYRGFFQTHVKERYLEHFLSWNSISWIELTPNLMLIFRFVAIGTFCHKI